MSDDDYTMGDLWRDVKAARRERRARYGVECPRCREVRPKAHPSILLPGQRCKVDGYRDPRRRASDEANEIPPGATGEL